MRGAGHLVALMHGWLGGWPLDGSHTSHHTSTCRQRNLSQDTGAQDPEYYGTISEAESGNLTCWDER